MKGQWEMWEQVWKKCRKIQRYRRGDLALFAVEQRKVVQQMSDSMIRLPSDREAPTQSEKSGQR